MRQHMVNASGRESCTQCCVFFSFHWANPKSKRKMKHLMARASESRFFSYVNWCFKRTCVALELRRFCFSVVFFFFLSFVFSTVIVWLGIIWKKRNIVRPEQKKTKQIFYGFCSITHQINLLLSIWDAVWRKTDDFNLLCNKRCWQSIGHFHTAVTLQINGYRYHLAIR